MNSTWELIRTITQHVTYATDTLHECQKHTTYLTTTYNDVILKLRGDNEVLNKKLTTIASDRNANGTLSIYFFKNKLNNVIVCLFINV